MEHPLNMSPTDALREVLEYLEDHDGDVLIIDSDTLMRQTLMIHMLLPWLGNIKEVYMDALAVAMLVPSTAQKVHEFIHHESYREVVEQFLSSITNKE